MRRVWVIATALVAMFCLPDARVSARCGGGFGTVAYVVTSCRVEDSGVIGWQEVRIRRSGCDEVTVARIASPVPVSDPVGLCEILARRHVGRSSGVAGVFQRIGVTRDGSAVVFEVSNEFQVLVTPRTPLAEEEQGFFWVRADGTGLRRLGPASRVSTYRVFMDRTGNLSAGSGTEIGFSADGRLIAFADLGPGPDGVEREQLFTIDVGTGERRQLTRLPATDPPPDGLPVIAAPVFRNREFSFGYRTGDVSLVGVVGVDGRGFRTYPATALPGDDGDIVPTFGVGAGRGTLIRLARVPVPGVPTNGDIVPGPITEVFRVFGSRHRVQLTNLRNALTNPVAARGAAVLFVSTADPFGSNPLGSCQIFRVSTLGAGLRQLTHFTAPGRSLQGCGIGEEPGCGIDYVNQESTGKRLVFYSDCDPFGTNPDGSAVFTIGYDGSLQQVTETAGARRGSDGVLEVEMPGPAARGGP